MPVTASHSCNLFDVFREWKKIDRQGGLKCTGSNIIHGDLGSRFDYHSRVPCFVVHPPPPPDFLTLVLKLSPNVGLTGIPPSSAVVPPLN